MNSEFIEAIEALEKERHIPKATLIEAIESALVSAYKKDYGTSQNVHVDIDQETGDINVYMAMDVVEWDDLVDEACQMSIDEAREIDPRYEVGDVVEYQVTPKDFGRIAAQTAKQVVVQRIREAERGMIYDDFITRQGEIVTGVVQRIANDTLFISIGQAEGILSPKEQVKGEKYDINDRIKVYIMDVKRSAKGPQIFLSRSHPYFVRKMFELEVPEIAEGIVVIKGAARDAGSRTKIAVYTEYENVDPVGSCVGPRGSRVQAIVDELNGEKIDIIHWSENPEELIANVLSPAKVEQVIINNEFGEKQAKVIVPDYQLSLAIGKEGQNVRLAAKVSGWKIDIKSHSKYLETLEEEENPWEDETETEANADIEANTEVEADTEDASVLAEVENAESETNEQRTEDNATTNGNENLSEASVPCDEA